MSQRTSNDDFFNDGEFALRYLAPKDVGNSYLQWLHNPEVTRFLGVRDSPPSTLEELRQWVASFNQQTRIIWGVFDTSLDLHVGNITVYSLDRKNQRAHLGYLIGDRNYWGRNVLPKTLPAAIDYAFEEFDLKKITAAADIGNIGSIIVLKKLGFVKEGHFKDHLFHDGEWFDEIYFANFRDDWITRRRADLSARTSQARLV